MLVPLVFQHAESIEGQLREASVYRLQIKHRRHVLQLAIDHQFNGPFLEEVVRVGPEIGLTWELASPRYGSESGIQRDGDRRRRIRAFTSRERTQRFVQPNSLGF